jgi:hypothetical protein
VPATSCGVCCLSFVKPGVVRRIGGTLPEHRPRARNRSVAGRPAWTTEWVFCGFSRQRIESRALRAGRDVGHPGRPGRTLPSPQIDVGGQRLMPASAVAAQPGDHDLVKQPDGAYVEHPARGAQNDGGEIEVVTKDLAESRADLLNRIRITRVDRRLVVSGRVRLARSDVDLIRTLYKCADVRCCFAGPRLARACEATRAESSTSLKLPNSHSSGSSRARRPRVLSRLHGRCPLRS